MKIKLFQILAMNGKKSTMCFFCQTSEFAENSSDELCKYIIIKCGNLKIFYLEDYVTRLSEKLGFKIVKISPGTHSQQIM